MSTPTEIESEHRAWLARVSELTGEPLDLEVVTRVLGLAKRTAHGTARPLAPIATYALGVAVGKGLDADEVLRAIVRPAPAAGTSGVVTNHAPENLVLLDVETDRLLTTCTRLSDARRDTLCAGWDVAHVLTHLARNAEALCNLVRWAVDGKERAAYASAQERDAAIEEGARRPLEEIVADVRETAFRFRELAQELTGPAGEAEVRTRKGTTVKGHQVVAMRTLEVVFHHVDLQTDYTFDQADPEWVARTLRRGVRQWESTGHAPALTLQPQGLPALPLGGGGPDVAGTPGQLLLWLARGRAEGLSSPVELPDPPPWA